MRMYVLFLAASCTKSPATVDARVAPTIDAVVPMDAPGCGQDDGWGDISTIAKAHPIAIGEELGGYVCLTTPDVFQVTGTGPKITIYTHTHGPDVEVLDAQGTVVTTNRSGECLPTLIPTPLACNFDFQIGTGTYYLRFAASDATPLIYDFKTFY